MIKKIYDWFADPDHALRIHGYAALFWFIAAFPICIFLNSSIAFLVFVSVYAIVVAHWSSWQATRTEAMQAQSDKEIREAVLRLRKFDPDHPQDEV